MAGRERAVAPAGALYGYGDREVYIEGHLGRGLQPAAEPEQMGVWGGEPGDEYGSEWIILNNT